MSDYPVYENANPLFVDLYVNDELIVGGIILLDRVFTVRNDYLGFVGDLAIVDTQGNEDPAGTPLRLPPPALRNAAQRALPLTLEGRLPPEASPNKVPGLGTRWLLTYWPVRPTAVDPSTAYQIVPLTDAPSQRISVTLGQQSCRIDVYTKSLNIVYDDNSIHIADDVSGLFNFTGTSSVDFKSASLAVTSFSITGASSVDFVAIPAVGETLAADAGSFALSGTAATSLKGYAVVAPSAAWALTGTASTPHKNYTLAAGAGSYALTGTAATMHKDYTLAAGAGSYTLTGTTASSLYARRVTAGVSSFNLVGSDAALTFESADAFALAAGAGSYTLTGSTASVLRGREVAAGVGSYTLTGSAASVLRGREVAAGVGSFVLTGSAASVRHANRVAAGAGSYTLTGSAASLLRGREVVAGVGSFLLTGTAAALNMSADTMITEDGDHMIAEDGNTMVAESM